MRVAQLILVAILTITAVAYPPAPAGGAPPAPAPRRLGPSPYSMEPRYFPETGHYISGRIRQYWEEHGGLAAFGYPLTSIFWDLQPDNDIRRVQYFERVRIEYVQGNAQPYDILLTLIGAEITADRRDEGPFLPAAPLHTPGTTFAAPTGHNLGGLFRQWWEGYGGLAQFGYPLSEEFRERNAADGHEYTVQYFERARFEHHPELAGTPDEVQLGQLGRERLARVGAPAIRVAPETAPPTGDDLPGYYLPPFPLIAERGALGANAYLLGPHDAGADEYNARTVGKLNEARLGWVRFQLVWRDFEPWQGHYDWLPLDTRIAAAHAAGQQILLSVVKPPAWASVPGRPGTFSEVTTPFYTMLTEVVSRYRGQVQAYEIGNEPNLASEVGGEVEIPRYFETVKAGYLAIKRTEPTAIVVLGSLLATGTDDPAIAVSAPTFLRKLYAYKKGQIRGLFDALGFHPASAINPPEAHFPGQPGSGVCPPGLGATAPCYRDAPDFYFRQVEDMRRIMEEHGDWAKQLWITEFGWDSCVGGPVPPGYEYCQLITEEEQAAYTVRAIAYARANWPWVGPMLLWNLNYATIPGIDPGQEMVGWSLLRADWSHRPVYEAVRQRQLPPPAAAQRYEQPHRAGTNRLLSSARADRTLIVGRQLPLSVLRASAEKSGGRWYRSTRAGSA